MINAENYNDKLTEITKAISDKLAGKNLINCDSGEICAINSMDKILFTANNDYDFLINFGEKSYYLKKACSKLFSITDEVTDVLNSFSNDIQELIDAQEQVCAKICERNAAEKKAREDKIAAEKAEIKRKGAIETLQIESISVNNRKNYDSNSYYVAVGYIARHVKRINAAMPDYLESWFVGIFGDVERRVVDSRKLSVGGFQSQWTLSMNIELDSTENMPLYLDKYMSKGKNSKRIANTAFVFDVMNSFAFKFGKSQNIDEIIDSVPEDQLAAFNEGYNG